MVRRVNAEGAPVDALAAMTFEPIGEEAQAAQAAQDDADAQEQAKQDAAEASMRAVEAGVVVVLVGALKMLRAYIAKSLPEIRGEWRDEVLQAPAAAAVPLLRKHLDTLMQMMGSNVELAMFAMACVPLGMGYMAAVEKAGNVVDMPSEPAADDAPA